MAETNHTGGAPQQRKRRRRGVTVGGVFLAIGKVIGTLLLIGVTTGAILACFATVYIKTVIMPQTQISVTDFALNLSSKIVYQDPATGEEKELRTLHGGENRVWVKYADIPKDLINATVAIEDERFYKHSGVDWKRTGGAFLRMFVGMKDTFGGSTLTQQLIKNITDQDEVTVKRKILEIFRALEFEKTHSKEDILEWYLNYIYLGESSYGVYTAAYTYFGKNLADLTLAECASLIGITNNPSMYDPYISEDTRIMNKDRQETILKKMEDLGYITTAERSAAKAQELNFKRGEDDVQPTTVYTWYEDQIIRDVTEDLRNTLHISSEMATRLVLNGGLTIYSNIDPRVQSIVDEIYTDQDNLPYKSATGQMMQSGIAIIDVNTGNVVALSGGMGEKTRSLNFSRASYKAKRPPGSSIKPLAVYSPAIELEMITPATVVDDSPHEIDAKGNPWPVNSFGEYRGLTTVYEALQYSVNTVAVKIMSNYLTPDAAYDFVTQKYGLKLEPGRYVGDRFFTDKAVAPLALGGLTDGVSPLEMAAAFSTFPRNGMYVAPRTYSKVLANDKTVLIDNQPESHVAIKESTAWYMTYMLKNAVKNGTGKAANFSGMEIAGKTGTTSSRMDLWFVGYTPYYAAAVWTGYDEQERMGSSLQQTATTMWNKVMSKVHEGMEYKDFAVPESVQSQLVQKSYCRDSGMIAGPDCALDPRGGRSTTTWFVGNSDAPSQYCTLHTSVTVCKDSPVLDGEGNPTGRFHLVGPFCPEESRQTVGVLDLTREGAAAMANVKDQAYVKSAYDAAGPCDVHTTEQPVEPTPPSFESIDPMNPATWPDPVEYPNFNPFDQTTWPGYTPPGGPSVPPVVPTMPVIPGPPVVTPTPPPAETPDPNEPFVPADGGNVA